MQGTFFSAGFRDMLISKTVIPNLKIKRGLTWINVFLINGLGVEVEWNNFRESRI
jgi:hypothetical protein